MSAVLTPSAAEYEQEQYNLSRRRERERAKERLLGYELRSLLRRWGEFLDNTRDLDGYPTAAAFTRIPGNEPGHRILCADMPKAVYFLNQAILRLDQLQQAYLFAWYAWLRDEYGHWIEQSDKARLMDMSYMAFRVEVHRSRERLLKLRSVWAI